MISWKTNKSRGFSETQYFLLHPHAMVAAPEFDNKLQGPSIYQI